MKTNELIVSILLCLTINIEYAQSMSIDSLLSDYQNTDEDSLRLDKLSKIANYYYFRDKYDTSTIYCKKLIEESLERNNYEKAFHGFNHIVSNFYAIGSYDSALYYSFKGLKILDEHNLHKEDFLAFIGEIYRATFKYDLAISHYNKAYSLTKDSSKLKSHILNRLASIYFEIENYPKALHYADSSIKMAPEKYHRFMQIPNLVIMGAVYREQESYEKALQCLKSAWNLLKDEHGPSIRSNILNNMATCYYSIGDNLNCIVYAKQAYNLSTKYGLKALTAISSEYLAKSYAKTGNFNTAYVYQKIYNDLREKLYNEKQERVISELNAKYESEKKEREIELQKVQIAKKDLKIKKNKTIIILFSSILFFFILFSIVIFVAFKKLRSANRLLSERNKRINEQKLLLEKNASQIKLAYNKLQELDQYKQAMTSMLVHDLKNPLNMLINVDILESEEKQLMVQQTGKHMLNTVMNLLDIYKSEENKLNLNEIRVDLFKILADSQSEVKFLAKQKNIMFKNECLNNYLIPADKEIFMRIFINLFTNAIKYSPPNSAIHINSSTTKGNRLRLSVKDKGIGIPKQYHRVIFEKFGQVEKKNNCPSGSTGLGLAFCKSAAEAHGWEIGVNSEPGKGAEFWILIKDFTSVETERENRIMDYSGLRDFKLEDSDLEKIESQIEKLKKLNVYAISEIKKITNQLRSQEFDEINSWLNEIQIAAETLNEEKYYTLIKSIES